MRLRIATCAYNNKALSTCPYNNNAVANCTCDNNTKQPLVLTVIMLSPSFLNSSLRLAYSTMCANDKIHSLSALHSRYCRCLMHNSASANSTRQYAAAATSDSKRPSDDHNTVSLMYLSNTLTRFISQKLVKERIKCIQIQCRAQHLVGHILR